VWTTTAQRQHVDGSRRRDGTPHRTTAATISRAVHATRLRHQLVVHQVAVAAPTAPPLQLKCTARAIHNLAVR
jgi:hypothetical protein